MYPESLTLAHDATDIYIYNYAVNNLLLCNIGNKKE